MELDSRKKSRRDRMMRSNSFDTQKVREIGRKEAEAVSERRKAFALSGSESLTSFTSRFLHLSRPPGFRRAFDASERNGRLGRIQSQRGKESSSRGQRKRRVFLC